MFLFFVVQDKSSFTLTVTANSTTDQFILEMKTRTSSESFNDKVWADTGVESSGDDNSKKLPAVDVKNSLNGKTEAATKGDYVKFRVINKGTGETVFESQEYRIDELSA